MCNQNSILFFINKLKTKKTIQFKLRFILIYQTNMGCANAKPQAHTKKQPLGQSSNTKLNSNVPHLASPIENPTYKNHVATTAKENGIPHNAVQDPKLIKSNLSDLQKNPYLTRQQVREQIEAKQKQMKRLQSLQKPQNITNVSRVQEIKGDNLGQKKWDTKQGVEQPIMTNEIPAKDFQFKLQRVTSGLETIPEGKEESEMTKKRHQSQFKIQEHHFDSKVHNKIQNDPHLRESNDLPFMDENYLVSRNSKQNQSPLRQHHTSSPLPMNQDETIKHQSQFKNNQNNFNQISLTSPIKENHQTNKEIHQSTIQENKQIQEKSQSLTKDPFNINQNYINNNQISRIQQSSIIKKKATPAREYNQITSEQIKINLFNETEKNNKRNLNDDSFTALTEQNFDLRCSFDPRTLIIDMNKISW